MKEEMEKYVDELYEIHKESSKRMIELTKENKAILDKLENRGFSYVEDIKWYSKFFFWLQFCVTASSLVVLIWTCYNFKKDFVGFKEGFSKNLHFKYEIALYLKDTLEKQDKILKELKKLNKEKCILKEEVNKEKKKL